MDSRTHKQKTGQARGKLMRLGWDLCRVKRDLKSATNNFITGGVILLIGITAFIVHILFGTPYIIAVVGLFIGGLMVGTALVKIRGARHSIDTVTDKVTDAQAEFDVLQEAE